ncbi:hypothetical protein AWE51_22145 [Aquimarina aggregata]|uniref:Beta-lactamase-related domain-containing protein n=1 Tax=Aquimarina aggregata TaxID=1642818 RepID=A0A163BHR7_9FLAO|nr:serine hydrolase [Aquimarina aggregata]KZS41407.1 hypothetical protein AWE51_22145 [Aquimarina aggregata]
MKTIKFIIVALIIVVSDYTFKINAQQNSNFQESSEFDALAVTIKEKMEKHKLYGLSVAVFEDYKVIWTQEWGIKAANSDDKIDANTSFSTASTSKAVVAMLCGVLEEKGLIDLDSPISKYLQRWKLPKSNFKKSGQITWMQLLSHTAGTTQGGFADFYEGDKIPTIVQSLKGELLPRYDKEIGFIFEPGTDWEYSGGGYVIIQMALEDHFKKPLAELMQEHILTPLGLENTTMKQPNEDGFLTNVAKVHNSKGEIIKTGLPITPQVAPSGMWSTPSDLSVIAIEMQNALRNKNNKVVSNAVAKRITDIVTLDKIGGWSAGWRRSFGIGNLDWFSHGGSNTGVGGEFMATMNGGNGIAILANGDKPNRMPVMGFLRNEVITMRGWKKPIQKSLLHKAPQELISAIQGPYLDFLFSAQVIDKIFEENGEVYINSPLFEFILNKKKNKMFYLGNNTFKIEDYPNYVQFNLSATNKFEGIVIYRDVDKKNKVIIKKEAVRNHKTELINAFMQNDINDAIITYKKVKKEAPSLNYEAMLNEFGYQFYIENNMEKAIAVLEFNAKEHSSSYNTFDSLGEIYELTGAIKKSIANYKKAAALNNSDDYKERVAQKVLELTRKL